MIGFAKKMSIPTANVHEVASNNGSLSSRSYASGMNSARSSYRRISGRSDNIGNLSARSNTNGNGDPFSGNMKHLQFNKRVLDIKPNEEHIINGYSEIE